MSRFVHFLHRRFVAILFVFSLQSLLLAAPEFDASILKAFPELGVKLPLLARATALPERMPLTQMLFFHEPDADLRVDFFSPLEIWYLNQLVGQWVDLEGNFLRLARVTCRPPEPDAPALTYDDFQSLVLTDDNRITSRSPRTELLEWAQTFTRQTVLNTQDVMINRFALDDALLLTLDDPSTSLYLLRPRFADHRPSEWFALILSTPAFPQKQAQALVESTVIPALATLSRFEAARLSDVAVVDQTRLTAKTPGGLDHPVRVLARRTVTPYPAWRVTELDNAILLSDVPKLVGESFFNDATRLLPPFRRTLATLLPPFSDAPDIAVVRIVRSALMFQRYAGETQKWAAGLYVPGRRELVMRQADSLDEMLRVFKHESTHQYLHAAFAGLPTSAWFNEGHAVFFESTTQKSGGAITFDEHPLYIELLTQNLDAFVELLPDLLTWSYADFYAGTDDDRRFRYALSWAFIYYLHKGAPLEFRTPHADLVQVYVDALRDSGNPDEATLQMLSTTELPKLQSAFKTFWLSNRTEGLAHDPLKK